MANAPVRVVNSGVRCNLGPPARTERQMMTDQLLRGGTNVLAVRRSDVLLFVFFSWLETRSLAHMLARVKKPRAKSRLHAVLAELPPIPWALVAVFVVLTLLLLAQLSLAAALLMLLLAIGAPVAYAYLDR